MLQDISRSDFEEILSVIQEDRGSRISYSNGALEIIVSLPEHEKHEVISDLVKMLLERLDIDFESLASTTFTSRQMNQALEADACFYIQNYRAVIGKDRLDSI